MMRKRGVLSAEVSIQVPFFDIDLMQIVWHGHYVKYLELARQALLDIMGHSYDAMFASGYAWPVIDMQLRYMQSATFGQHLSVRAELIEWEQRLKIHYLICDATSGTRLTRASSIQVAVSVATREMQFQSPPVFLKSVRAAIARSDASAATKVRS